MVKVLILKKDKVDSKLNLKILIVTNKLIKNSG